MQGHPEIITHLNDLLAGELTAIDQYFIHARMYEDWGYQKLYARVDHEREDEIGHADALVKRILFLQGRPDVATRAPLRIGTDVPEMLRNDLALEHEVVDHLRRVIAACEAAADFVTRDMLVQMLDDTEQDHAHWLEIQLRLIEHLGLPRYLQSQTEAAPG